MGIFQIPPGAEGWHEDNLIVSVLSSGTTLIKEIWKVVHLRQSAKMAKMGSPPHSKSNFRNRVKSLIKRGVIYQDGTELVLTNLGKWVAISKLLDQDERLAFVDTWVCGTCTNTGHIVILTPLLQTIKKTSNGIRLDATCPSCGQLSIYLPPPSGMDPGTFINFYSDVIDDLGQYAQLSAAKIDCPS